MYQKLLKSKDAFSNVSKVVIGNKTIVTKTVGRRKITCNRDLKRFKESPVRTFKKISLGL